LPPPSTLFSLGVVFFFVFVVVGVGLGIPIFPPNSLSTPNSLPGGWSFFRVGDFGFFHAFPSFPLRSSVAAPPFQSTVCHAPALASLILPFFFFRLRRVLQRVIIPACLPFLLDQPTYLPMLFVPLRTIFTGLCFAGNHCHWSDGRPIDYFRIVAFPD